VITNIPTPESLEDIALRLYFSAWSSLINIRSQFDSVYDPGAEEMGPPIDWADEWNEYLVACQPELQSICTQMQQSNELALKAKICSVSP
jgi:hypothetical protein